MADEPGTELVPVTSSRFQLDDLRVRAHAHQEALRLGAIQGKLRNSVGVEIEVFYDMGDARVALLDLERVFKKVQLQLRQALAGERALQGEGR